MRIGINTRFLLKDKMEGFGWYTYEICQRMVQNNPDDEFYFFFDRPYDSQFVFGKNVTPVVLSPPARHPILFVLWFDWAIPRALKKYKIDVFFSPDGYLSLRTKVPQVGTIHDINFEHYPKDIPLTARTYLRYFFPKFAKKAAHIITVSDYSKEDISRTYNIPKEKITAIWNGANSSFTPLGIAEQAATRNRLTNGKPYFLFVGSLHPRKNLERLLRAYEKLTQENSEVAFDLVVVGAALWKEQKTNDWVSTKTLERIHFLGHVALNELTKIMGSAQIFVYVPYFEGFGIPLVEAMQCGIPIVAGNQTSLPEVAGEAAVYCDPFSVDDIANKILALATDSTLQEEKRAIGLERAAQFSWDFAAQKVYHVLKETQNHNSSFKL